MHLRTLKAKITRSPAPRIIKHFWTIINSFAIKLLSHIYKNCRLAIKFLLLSKSAEFLKSHTARPFFLKPFYSSPEAILGKTSPNIAIKIIGWKVDLSQRASTGRSQIFLMVKPAKF